MGRVVFGALLLAGITLLALVGPSMVSGHPSPPVGSGALSSAPRELVAVAQRAARATGADPNVLLAISNVECDYGQCRAGLPDTMVPADVRGRVDRAALQPGGATARLLGLPDGRRLGDWVDPLAVAGGQHAMGFMQFLPSTWRAESSRAPGRPRDPYQPYDSMVVAGSYLSRLESGAVDGQRRDLSAALAVYGGDPAYASQVLALLPR